MIYIKVNDKEYEAKVVCDYSDRDWNERPTQTLYLTMTPDQVAALLPSGTPWSIVQRDMVDKFDNDGNPTGQTEEVVTEEDNSAYSLAGDITDHRDGTVSIKMGKPTEAETLRAQLAEIEEAYDEQ